MPTKEQTRHIDRQPFQLDTLVEFCGTKKLAQRLAVDLGDALNEADRARNRGDSDDTAFELMFWDGTLFLDSDDQYDTLLIHLVAPTTVCSDVGYRSAYDEALDATFYLGNYGRHRFIAVRYEFKEDEYAVSAWWLTRDDQMSR
tara:strand:- start:169 stop:600 length:432 start_codon:yes stop_codon:yes gene_type:complete